MLITTRLIITITILIKTLVMYQITQNMTIITITVITTLALTMPPIPGTLITPVAQI